MFVVFGILFNYELFRRGLEFVICKVIDGVVKIKFGLVDYLLFGNFDVC